MSKSIAELRQSPHVGLPERTYPLCLASTLVGEVQALLGQLEDARAADRAQTEGDESAAKPKRMGAGSGTAKIRKRLAELSEEMREHTGTLTLRGTDEGAWRLWVEAHPAREGNDRDARIAYGACNADDLIDDLGKYAAAWNDDPIAAGDWDFIRSCICRLGNSAAWGLEYIAATGPLRIFTLSGIEPHVALQVLLNGGRAARMF